MIWKNKRGVGGVVVVGGGALIEASVSVGETRRAEERRIDR